MEDEDDGEGDEDDKLHPGLERPESQIHPLLLHKSPGCGNFYVAARLIATGEILLEETCLQNSAYGFPHTRPDCLTCYKDLSYSQKCRICRWPICSRICSQAPQHSNFECRALARKKVTYDPDSGVLEYLGIETLRCLLLREKCVTKWKQIHSLESHALQRMDKAKAITEISHIVRFIRVRCKLIEFEESTIIRVLGIICVNAFSAISYIGRSVSLLFAEASLLNHDCTPNTGRQFWEEGNNSGGDSDEALKFSVQIIAARAIGQGEVISTNYADLSAGIVARGKFLSERYFFQCDCVRCRCELFDEIHYSNPPDS